MPLHMEVTAPTSMSCCADAFSIIGGSRCLVPPNITFVLQTLNNTSGTEIRPPWEQLQTITKKKKKVVLVFLLGDEYSLILPE